MAEKTVSSYISDIRRLLDGLELKLERDEHARNEKKQEYEIGAEDPRQTFRDTLTGILDANLRPMETNEIVARAKARRPYVSESSVRAQLVKLANDGKILRIYRGVYASVLTVGSIQD